MLSIREAVPDDAELLWGYLAIAGQVENAQAAKNSPSLRKYLEGWQRSDDFGCIAELDGKPVGACWARQALPEENRYFYIDAHTPEVSIGIDEHARKREIGMKLLDALARMARSRGLIRLCLCVRASNTAALRLYTKLGYKIVEGSAVATRGGSYSLGMLYEIPAQDTLAENTRWQ